MDTHEPTAGGRGRSHSLAALLSFLWPGLGQLYLRNRRAAAVFAVPALLILLLVAYELRQGPFVFAARFVDPAFSRDAAFLVLIFGAWRLVAVVHAFVDGARPAGGKMLDRAVVVVLVAVIAVSHLGTGLILAKASDASNQVFHSQSSFIDLTTPRPTAIPSVDPSASPEPTATPVQTPSIGSRVTILLTGFDAAPTRGEVLYDSNIVVSYDPKTNSVQMVSMPRDSTSFPLYFGRHPVVPTWLRLNSIPTNVAKGGIYGSPDSPYMTLVNQISYMVGVRIDSYAAMDLLGFVKMIDLVGGIDVNNPAAINDPTYDWLDGHLGVFNLAAGPQHLDGQHALAYVRSRKSPGDNDFGRSSRQQEVLLALLHKMARPDQILNLPTLISTLASTITTNFPPNQVADYIAIGQDVPSANIQQAVLSPTAGYSEYLPSGALCLFNARVAALSVQMYGKDSLWYGKPAPANTCPA